MCSKPDLLLPKSEWEGFTGLSGSGCYLLASRPMGKGFTRPIVYLPAVFKSINDDRVASGSALLRALGLDTLCLWITGIPFG